MANVHEESVRMVEAIGKFCEESVAFHAAHDRHGASGDAQTYLR
jgi:hypothetical protein